MTRAELLQLLIGSAAAAAAPSAALAEAQPGAEGSSLAARVAALEARAEIHELMMAYGRTLDRRDFQAFEALWAADAEYGPAKAPAKGPAAIRAVLEASFARNVAGVKDPSFHVFFDEAIGPIEGDHATAFSRSAWVATSPAGVLEVVVTAHYEDVFVREDGHWKFRRRVIAADLPAPAARTHSN